LDHWKGDYIEQITRRLALSGQPTIDAFLENLPEFASPVKIAIADILFECEKKSVALVDSGTPHDALGRLIFERTLANTRVFRDPPPRIISLNYDRLLEFSLATKIENAYPIKEGDLPNLLAERLPILHLHGSLGDLAKNSNNYAAYAGQGQIDDWPSLVRRFAMVHEEPLLEQNYEMAKHWILASETICFLGFGYHQIVLERLGRECFNGKRVLGTTRGLGRLGQSAVHAFFNGTASEIGLSELAAVEFLAESPVLT
jgi:hypothetical protein